MAVRRAGSGDFSVIHSLLDQLMPGEQRRREAVWAELMDDHVYVAWIAETENQPAGFLDLYVFPDVAHGQRIGVIGNLVVDARYRGRGVGKSLLREAITHCRDQDVVELHVWTDFDNEPAQRLYRKHGFVDRALLLELEMK